MKNLTLTPKADNRRELFGIMGLPRKVSTLFLFRAMALLKPQTVFCVWMVFFLYGSQAFAFEPFKAFSPPQKEISILKVEALVQPAARKPGEVFRLHLRITLAEGWHIYSLKSPKGKQENLSTRIFLDGEGLIDPGTWREPDPKITHDGALGRIVPIHEGFVEFDWEGRVSVDAQSGTHPLAGSIEFRACDNRICTLPRKTSFTALLVVLPD